MSFKRGFKTWCENTSLGIRRDLKQEKLSPLDPRDLAKHLGVMVVTVKQVQEAGGLEDRYVNQLINIDSGSWSAVTLFLSTVKLIIVNTNHSPARQNSDIMHELSHLILEHKPSRVDVTEDGLMILDTYDRLQEDEANWLSSALLVPREGLLAVLAKGSSTVDAAAFFRVSRDMIDWRRNTTGLEMQLKYRALKR